jgi:hypothetical protein
MGAGSLEFQDFQAFITIVLRELYKQELAFWKLQLAKENQNKGSANAIKLCEDNIKEYEEKLKK